MMDFFYGTYQPYYFGNKSLKQIRIICDNSINF